MNKNNLQTAQPPMQIHTLKSFGVDNLTGSVALVIEADIFTQEERLEFTSKQNKPACVFMQQDSDNNLILDFYYPHSRSPLCIHGAMAAGYVYFSKNPQISKITAITAMHKQKIVLEKQENNIFINVMPENIEPKKIGNELIRQLLNINLSYIIGSPVIASVGSSKLLVEVENFDILNAIKPNLELIVKWGKENKISGCYAYCQMADGTHQGRNFNHLNATLEDQATGVAAGALTAHLKKNIVLLQGTKLNNQCVMRTRYSSNNILIGGNVTSIKDTVKTI
jgi:PhzF family phenazine biosynthesis protein